MLKRLIQHIVHCDVSIKSGPQQQQGKGELFSSIYGHIYEPAKGPLWHITIVRFCSTLYDNYKMQWAEVTNHRGVYKFFHLKMEFFL